MPGSDGTAPAVVWWLWICSGQFGFIEPGSSCLGVAFVATHFSAQRIAGAKIAAETKTLLHFFQLLVQLVCSQKFLLQFLGRQPRAQILDSLLQPVQRPRNIRGVGVRDVAP